MRAYVQAHDLERHLSRAVNEAVRAGSDKPLLYLADAIARIAADEQPQQPARSALNRRGSFGTNSSLPPNPEELEAAAKAKPRRRSSFSEHIADHTKEKARLTDFASAARRDSTNEAAALRAAAAAAEEGVAEEAESPGETNKPTATAPDG